MPPERRCRKLLEAMALMLYGRQETFARYGVNFVFRTVFPKYIHSPGLRKHRCSGWHYCLRLNSAFSYTYTIVLQKVGIR